MKVISQGLMSALLLAMLVSCGKGNESGKGTLNNPYTYGNPYQQGYPPIANANSPYRLPNGLTVNQVMSENRCANGFGGMPGMNQPYAGQRIPIQVPLVGFPSTIQTGDVFVGVTSFGDVAALVGGAPGQPPMFVGYMCPRAFAPQGQGQLMGIKIGVYTRCQFKPITAATVLLPGGATAEFRMLDFGTSMGQRFSFCQM